MKHISMKIKFGLAAALLASACTNELSESPTDDARAIAFAPLAETRAAVDGTELPSNSSFKVWGGYDNNVNNVFNGVTVTESNGSWSYSGTQYWLPGKEYNFWGVYPANLQGVTISSVGSSAGNIEVKSFDCSATGDAAIDLMTATSDPNLSGDVAPIVEMKFSHELSRLKFTVKAEDGVTATVTNAKLYGVIYKADFAKSGQNTTWANPETYDETKTQFKSETPQPLPIDNIFSDILIIPDDNLDGVIFELTYYFNKNSQSQTTKKIMVKTNSTPSWEKGKNYSYTVTIGPTSIQFQPVVTPWNHSTGGIITVE